MPSFIATDLEGTLSAAEGWRSIRHYFDTHNQRNVFQRFFIRQIPRVYLNRFGLIDVQTLRNKWMEDMAVIFKGFTPEQLAEVGEWVIDNHIWPERREAVLAEILAQHAEGVTILLVSSLYQPMLDRMVKRLGTERIEAFGTPLEMKDGVCTGRCAGPICGGDVKAQRVTERVGTGYLIAAYGDTAGDLPMLAISQKPTAVFPDPDLQKVVQQKGWRVIDK
jgi:HAD superfamily phosphoserine phosphatase-like hydrolase